MSNNDPNKPQPSKPAPFTADETIVFESGNTTYISTAKYKVGSKEGALDKMWRLIEHNLENMDNPRYNNTHKGDESGKEFP